MLKRDPFISDIIGKPAWMVSDTNHLEEKDFARGNDGFVYAKADCQNIISIGRLEKFGFHLIDTNVQLDRFSSGLLYDLQVPKNYKIDFAEPENAQRVEQIAATSFKYTRFHLDPFISDKFANDIKRQWAGNFFKKIRGDYMVVLKYKTEIVGFLQLILKDKNLIIDLIAIDKLHQGKGLAGVMINFAANHLDKWQRMLVGTQVTNIPSMRSYVKQGFNICQSSYIFHYHGGMKL
ncbi:MAG: hypothetical protein CMM02_06405 [Rhodopirellula sp.]|nr:hypothetical protein [Rhodopirellula sp.]